MNISRAGRSMAGKQWQKVNMLKSDLFSSSAHCSVAPHCYVGIKQDQQVNTQSWDCMDDLNSIAMVITHLQEMNMHYS